MKRLFTLFCILFLVAGLSACGSSEEEPLVVYSGRTQALVEGLVERFRAESDVPIEVRYGTDAQLLATLKEEGSASPADLYWANSTAALAEAIRADLLTVLPESLRSHAATYQPEGGRWTPVTSRFRVLAYNPTQIDSTELPASVMDLPEMEQLEGRIGWTPAYASFQDFITAMREIHGEEATRAWIEGMQDLNPKAWTGNTPMIRALAAGEIDLALTNHYYIMRLKHGGPEGEYEGHEEGEEEEHAEAEEEQVRPNAPVAIYHFAPGDVGNLALVTGAGILQTSDQEEAAQEFLAFLLSPEAQRFAAQTVNEYPVVEGVDVPPYMIPVEEALALSPEVPFEALQDVDSTLALLRETGAL